MGGWKGKEGRKMTLKADSKLQLSETYVCLTALKTGEAGLKDE